MITHANLTTVSGLDPLFGDRIAFPDVSSVRIASNCSEDGQTKSSRVSARAVCWVIRTKHTYGSSSDDEGSQRQSPGSSKPFKGVATSVHSVLVDQCSSSVSGPKTKVFSARQPSGSHLAVSGMSSHLPPLEHRKRVDISAPQISEWSEILVAPMRVSPLSQILHS